MFEVVIIVLFHYASCASTAEARVRGPVEFIRPISALRFRISEGLTQAQS